ncbi:MAG: TldD/PmbA family protein, partial [candidate division NC10 bacterium]
MKKIETSLIDQITPMVQSLATGYARSLAHLSYADLRVEIAEGKAAAAENGAAKYSGEDYGFAFGIRVLAGDRMVAPGYFGRSLGAADLADLESILKEGIRSAYRRALANGEWKADARGKFGSLGESLMDTRLHPIEVRQDVVPAEYETDPRAMDLGEMVRYTTDISKQMAGLLKYNYIATVTQLSRELFASSEGALIDQSFAMTQGMVYVVAVQDGVSQELYDVLGHQRGWEILLRGINEPLIQFPNFVEFSLAMAREAAELANAPALPSTNDEVVVVTDPHYNTLVSHEIIGHPVEL